MSTPLRVVKPASAGQVPSAAAGLAERVQQLQAEARGLAHEHVELLRASLHEAERLAGEVAGGGDAYPVGVRELARRLAEDCAANAQTLQILSERFAH